MAESKKLIKFHFLGGILVFRDIEQNSFNGALAIHLHIYETNSELQSLTVSRQLYISQILLF